MAKITFTNVERFKAWLDEVLKSEYCDFDKYLEDLEYDYGINGSAEYEVRGFFTKSGNPEVYRYEVKDTLYLNGEIIPEDDERIEEADDFDREYIF